MDGVRSKWFERMIHSGWVWLELQQSWPDKFRRVCSWVSENCRVSLIVSYCRFNPERFKNFIAFLWYVTLSVITPVWSLDISLLHIRVLSRELGTVFKLIDHRELSGSILRPLIVVPKRKFWVFTFIFLLLVFEQNHRWVCLEYVLWSERGNLELCLGHLERTAILFYWIICLFLNITLAFELGIVDVSK